jgi:hypothetical protein
MKCPKCGMDISVAGAVYDFTRGCPACGWRRSEDRQSPEPEGEFTVSPGEWVVCWILAIPLVLGPYVALWWFRADWPFAALVWKYYWPGWGVYLVIAFLFSPEPSEDTDGSRVGAIYLWLGRGGLPGLFSSEEEAIGIMGLLALTLVPGKIVLAALFGLPHYLWLTMRLRRKSRMLEREARRKDRVEF